MMNIDGIGEETAAALYNKNLVTNFSDLYTLTDEQLLTIDGFGPRSAERVLDGIEASKQVPFERVIYALSIPYVGETTAKKIARAVNNIDELMSWPAERLEAIEDVGPRIARSIISYFEAPVNRENIEKLRAAGYSLQCPRKPRASEQIYLPANRSLSAEYSRCTVAMNTRSLSRKTVVKRRLYFQENRLCIGGENMGPAKLEKANKLGIPIISEQDFLKMLEF